jgi:superfamily II DNA or RNA helicase
MLLADRCSSEFGDQIKARGKQYFQEGRVHLGSVVGGTVEATVCGHSGDYTVLLDWSEAGDGFVEARCTCPHFDSGAFCKHLWATMLAAGSRGIGPLAARGNLSLLHADSDDEDLDDWDDDADDDDAYHGGWRQSPSDSRRRASLPWQPSGPPRPKHVAGWQQQLAPVFGGDSAPSRAAAPLSHLGKTREAWFVLDVAASRETSTVVIRLFHRETKLNGEFGKLKPLRIDRRSVAQFPNPDDCEILQLLLSNGREADESSHSYRDRYSYYGHYGYEPKIAAVALTAGVCPQVLPKLCATGRLVWMIDGSRGDPETEGRGVTWDGGPAWRFRLCIAPDEENKRWLLAGQLVRGDGEAAVALKSPPLVLADGLTLLDDRLARLDAGGSSAWIAALRRSPEIAVPYRDRWELIERLWRLPSQPEASLPANLACLPSHFPPQGRLIVHSPQRSGRNRLYADVEFHYDGRKVRAADSASGLVDREHERVLVRNREKEREMLGLLFAQGLRATDGYDSPEHDLWLLPQRLAAVVETLVQAGWIVEAEGLRIRKPGQWRLSVTSGVDWFDLEGTCEFDGVTAKLPELLAALRHGEKFVRLGDGSRGLLPQEWLDKFAALANLGETEGDCVRFRPSQALLLDALLAAQKEVSVDRQFAHVRRKLRSFEGVSPRAEPRGFDGRLRDYQKGGLGWLHFLRDFRLGGCLADDMGLGKTVQVLALLQARRTRPKQNGRRAPSLAVVPRSLVFNWIEEARRFTPNLRVLDYTGPLRKEAFNGLDAYDLVVTTYGTLHRDIAKFKNLRFDYAILDEAQAIKNAQSQRAKTCRLLRADHRLAMTGTPVENHLGELWSLFEFLNPGMLGSSSVFQRISRNVTQESESLPMLRRALAPFILRRTKGQVLTELPAKTEQTLYCDLEGPQQKRYRELREYYRLAISKKIKETGLAKAKIHVLEALLRLRQAALHPGLLDPDCLDQPSAKLDVLLEQLKAVIEEGHKALIFSQFTSLLSIVRRRLDAEKTLYEYLDGRTRQRQERVDRFQNDPACRLFLISLKAGGHGLNLTAADYVFILDPWWNPAVEAQAVDRTHRIGQTRRVFAYRLIARDTVEEKILELQKTKRDLAEAIVSSDGNLLGNLTAEDLEMLLA